MGKKITNRFAIINRFENMVKGWPILERFATYAQARNALRDGFAEPKDYQIVDLADAGNNVARLVRENNGIKL